MREFDRWDRRIMIRAGAAVVATLAVWLTLRLIFPSLDYFPPELLVSNLERSWFAAAGVRKMIMAGYAAVTLVLLAVFFKAVQQRWPGRRDLKGLALGLWVCVIWQLGFLCGWAFHGTTLKAELLNGVIDLAGPGLGGLLIGLAVGRDVPTLADGTWRPWLAVLCVAAGFVSVHAVATSLLANITGLATDLLFVPTTLRQLVILLGVGVCAGGMYVMIRPGLPFSNVAARVAFFAFGLFGYIWTWFHIFNVIEFTGVLVTVLVLGLIGATGVFAGALVYERLAIWGRKVYRAHRADGRLSSQ